MGKTVHGFLNDVLFRFPVKTYSRQIDQYRMLFIKIHARGNIQSKNNKANILLTYFLVLRSALPS